MTAYLIEKHFKHLNVHTTQNWTSRERLFLNMKFALSNYKNSATNHVNTMNFYDHTNCNFNRTQNASDFL